MPRSPRSKPASIDDACRGFEEVARAVPGDKVAAGYLARARHLLDRGVPEGWDGVVTLDHK